MSFDSRRMLDEDQNKEIDSMSSYQRNTYFGSIVQHTSSINIDVRQLQTELQIQHQHEKDSLNQLNQRFHLFIDRIQSLQVQNAKYLAAITDIRGQYSGISTTSEDEGYLSIRSNYSSISHAKIDYEWDLELFQLQIGIYRRLIELEQQSRDKRISILEEELKKSVSALISLRSSYEQTQQVVENLYGESGDLAQQYLLLTRDWCNIRKQRKKWDLSMETLKSYIGFYKNLRSNLVIKSKSSSTTSDETKQFWVLELDTIVKRIRQDFEAFYGAIHQQMIVYYQTKTEEAETNIKQALNYQHVEYEKLTMSQQKLHIEYEKVQTSLTYEKEVFIKLESTYSKLEADFQSIQFQYGERLEVQSNDLQNVQESIMAMAYDVDEIRRSKADLEVEIIIYRQLLDAAGIETSTRIVSSVQPVVHEQTGSFVLKSQKRGAISIKACAPNGAYISLINAFTNRTVDISKWILTRDVDQRAKIRYTIPDGVRLDPGSELRIYAKRTGVGTTGESIVYQKIVNNNVTSWGEGNMIETFLFNQNGDEEASYTQSATIQRI